MTAITTNMIPSGKVGKIKIISIDRIRRQDFNKNPDKYYKAHRLVEYGKILKERLNRKDFIDEVKRSYDYKRGGRAFVGDRFVPIFYEIKSDRRLTLKSFQKEVSPEVRKRMIEEKLFFIDANKKKSAKKTTAKKTIAKKTTAKKTTAKKKTTRVSAATKLAKIRKILC